MGNCDFVSGSTTYGATPVEQKALHEQRKQYVNTEDKPMTIEDSSAQAGVCALNPHSPYCRDSRMPSEPVEHQSARAACML